MKIYILYTRDGKRHTFGYNCTHIEFSDEERFVSFYTDTDNGRELMGVYPTAFISFIKCTDKREDPEVAC